MSSLQTRLARSQAAEAAEALARHIKMCATCRDAHDRDQPGRRCVDGQQLAADARNLRVIARDEARRDEAPNPRQGTLFGQGELFGDE